MIRIVATLASIVFAIALSSPASAQDIDAASPSSPPQAAPADAGIINLDTVTVTGSQPGPGLWRITKGDHELWILGTLNALPAEITWNADEAGALVAASQELILEPTFTVDTDTGFFKTLYLGYKFYQAKKNPDGQTLEDVLPPDLYARWSRLKDRYLPGKRSVERKRPLVAAETLLSAAGKRSGLTDEPMVQPIIIDIAKAHSVAIRQPAVKVTVDDASAALKEARKVALADADCLSATLDTIEQDLPRMVTNANAWSVGDIGRIDFSRLERRDRLCSQAFSGAEFARERGIPDIQAAGEAKWLAAAESALDRNSTTFSMVPLQDITGPDGYAAQLAAKGYTVEAP